MKPLFWTGPTQRDLAEMPEEVRRTLGHALWLAQLGGKHEKAKPLRGLGSASVLEIVEREESGAYRAVYTVSFAEAVVVLHCFKKKSKRGIATPKADMDLIRSRLKDAQMLIQELRNGNAKKIRGERHGV